MSAPMVSPAFRDREPDDGAGVVPGFAPGAGAVRVPGPGGHGERPPLDDALTGAFAAAAYPKPVRARQVRTLVTRLAADPGTVTWLCVRDEYEPPAAWTGSGDPVAGPLLTRAEPVRVLVCAPTTGWARALAAANSGVPVGWLRVARPGAALRGTRGDLVVTAGGESLAVAPGPDGAVRADEVSSVATNRLLRALVDSLWDRGLPPASAVRIEEVAREPVKLKILGLLEAGAKDEVIARAVNVSLRTCRRHIAGLLSAADAGSRFQAASQFARAGLLSAGADSGAGRVHGRVSCISTAAHKVR